MIRFFLVLLLLGIPTFLFAQEAKKDTLPPSPIYQQDSIIGFRALTEPEVVENFDMISEGHDPNKAAWYSAAVPGLGQTYNRKYWKIPLVWGGIAGFAYLIDWNNDQYQFFRKNLLYETNGNQPGFENETNLDSSTLKSGRDQYRRSRDMMVIFGVLFYMLQIADAHVDAHLIEFDVNQDLSVQINPSMQFAPNNSFSTGLTFSLNF
ncbi:MAG: DUF5683 domain-containing protein [Cyclobacteriaceae bacterium]|nr:DUF5683 domain-containing protein [Cyclobacteriaceae bacterium]